MPGRSGTFTTSLRWQKITQEEKLLFFRAFNRHHIFCNYSCYILLNEKALAGLQLGHWEEGIKFPKEFQVAQMLVRQELGFFQPTETAIYLSSATDWRHL